MAEEIRFQQSSVVPYKFNNGSIRILLITSIRKGNWIVPKGYVEFNLSPFESAKKEAFEEAGVIGTNETVELGSYQKSNGGNTTNIKVFSMEVTKELEDYPEKHLRKRKWFDLDEAVDKVKNDDLADLLTSMKQKVQKLN